MKDVHLFMMLVGELMRECTTFVLVKPLSSRKAGPLCCNSMYMNSQVLIFVAKSGKTLRMVFFAKIAIAIFINSTPLELTFVQVCDQSPVPFQWRQKRQGYDVRRRLSAYRSKRSSVSQFTWRTRCL